MHWNPWEPHALAAVPGWHVPDISQHPVMQDRWHVRGLPPELLELLPLPELLPPLELPLGAPQLPFWHVSLDPQMRHEPPPVPQLFESDVPAWHWPEESQHPAHVEPHEPASGAPPSPPSSSVEPSSPGAVPELPLPLPLPPLLPLLPL
jgi:hypothetical protein